MEHEPVPLDEFEGHWQFETISPCPEALALLKGFAERSPSLYELAERVGFIDPVHPGFKTNSLWLAFARHYSACKDCNEV